MLRHGALMSRYFARPYVTLAHTASYRLLIQKACLPALGQAILLQSVPRQCPSYLLFANRHCFPALSQDMTPLLLQHMPCYRTFERPKMRMTYYGFAKRNPPRPSKFAQFYYIVISLGLLSFVFTPL